MGTAESAVLVVTTMPLSKTARAELSDMLGPGYTVVDIRSAPPTANIVLTPVVSGNALGILRSMFPQARILYTELQDDERGISYAGPLARIVALEPDGYFVAHSLDALTPIVQTEAKLQLTGSTRRTPLTLSLDSGTAAPQPERPADVRQGDRHLADAQPGDAQPGDAPPGDAPPGDRQPGDRQAGDRQAGDGQPGDARSADPRLADDAPGAFTVRWIDRVASPDTRGRWLDLDPIDALVVSLVGTDDPRRDILWPALVAECVVRLADCSPDDVLVDIAGLDPKIRAELQIRIESEQLDQTPWP